uniref:Uncharacterized protein n=1 Tax=Arundo donax TaxID=35708 RepID=A0A0A9CF38_ARUDO
MQHYKMETILLSGTPLSGSQQNCTETTANLVFWFRLERLRRNKREPAEAIEAAST